MPAQTLRGMTWDHPRGYHCLEAASEAYAAAHDVEIIWDRRSLQAFADAPIDAIAERYDLIVLDHPHVGMIAGRGEETLPFSDRLFCSDANGMVSLAVLKGLYKAGPAEAVNWNPITVLEAMSTTDEFAYSPCLFGYINYARPGFRSHTLDYCDLPSFRGTTKKRGILGGAGLGVSARSDNPDAAQAFAAWIASEPVQSGIYLENEGQPGHRQTWLNKRDDPRFAGFLKGAYHTMENAWTRPRDIWFLGFVDDVCAIFPDFFLRDRDEAAFLAEINALYRKHRENWV